MGIVIDSSILIDIERLGSELPPYLAERNDEEIFLSVISASELLHGVYRAKSEKQRTVRLAFVEGLLAALPVLMIDLPTARSHARIWSDLTKRGEMIGVHDSWIAATCIAHGLSIATRNPREFTRVPGLAIEVWK